MLEDDGFRVVTTAARHQSIKLTTKTRKQGVWRRVGRAAVDDLEDSVVVREKGSSGKRDLDTEIVNQTGSSKKFKGLVQNFDSPSIENAQTEGKDFPFQDVVSSPVAQTLGLLQGISALDFGGKQGEVHDSGLGYDTDSLGVATGMVFGVGSEYQSSSGTGCETGISASRSLPACRKQ
ncbi:hypothetical protein Q3G72_024447 [Acer saccharum]|nr:hypothetical protein Q3G72_024447 [Acer saccharum]